jgi:hypothetical protein
MPMPDTMASNFSPLISEGRHALLDLGVVGCSDCRIAGFAGNDVFLDVRAGLLDGIQTRPGYLLLDDSGTLRATRGSVSAGRSPGTAVLRVTDRFTGQRRLFSRAPLAVRTHVRGLGGAAAEWDTFTRDISAGGVAIARRAEWDGAMSCELTLAPAEAVELVVQAEVRRVEADALGLRFTEVAPSARALLAELALAYHRTALSA